MTNDPQNTADNDETANLTDNEAEDSVKTKRPDPLFKLLLTEAAHEAGIRSEPTELVVQQTSSSDLMLTIPLNTELSGTLFDFFRSYNVIEFKSYHDVLNREKFKVQMARSLLWSSRKPKVDLDDFLSIIVSSRYPREVLDYSAERGSTFKRGADERRWLLTARWGWLDVAIVVCDELPVEPRYSPWLLFSPPTTAKWRETLLMLARERNWEFLDLAAALSPEEYRKMEVQIYDILAQYGPEEQERLRKEWGTAVTKSWPTLDKVTKKRILANAEPDELKGTLASYSTEQLQESLADLTEQQKEALLKLLAKRKSAKKPSKKDKAKQD